MISVAEKEFKRAFRSIINFDSMSFKIVYGIFPFFIIPYYTLPFLLLNWNDSWEFYKSLGFCGHVFALLLFLVSKAVELARKSPKIKEK